VLGVRTGDRRPAVAPNPPAQATPAGGGGRPRRGVRHVRALDGIRGIAVAAVLLYHGGVAWAGGGFLGVDVFFVLSGYLITSLLLAEHDATGRIDLLAFWQRRARRLLPALALVAVFVAAYAAFAAAPAELARIRGDGLATLLYVQNWHAIAADGSYFEAFAAPSPLRHAWSLAIEEQFYLAWPVVFGALAWRRRTGTRRVVLVAAAGGAVGSALLAATLHEPLADPSRVYYGTDTRAQALLVGVALAALLPLPPAGSEPAAPAGRAASFAAALGAAALFLAVVAGRDTDRWLYEGGFLAVALAAAALVAGAVAGRPRWLAALLRSRPLVAVGAVSYGLYLWHWPVFVWLTPDRTGLDGRGLLGARLGLTTLLAAASFRFVEQPIRTGAWRLRWAVAAPAGAVALGGLLLLATAAPAPVATTAPAAPQPGAGAAVDGGARTGTAVPGSGAPADLPAGLPGRPRAPDSGGRVGAPGRGTDQVARPTAVGGEGGSLLDRIVVDLRPPSGRPRVLVVGDSVTFTLHEAPGTVGDGSVEYWWFAPWGCSIAGDRMVSQGVAADFDTECAQWPDAWERAVEVRLPDLAVVQIGAWEVFDHVVGGEVLEVGSAAYAERLGERLRLGIDRLAHLGTPVVLVEVPCMGSDPRRLRADGERQDADRVAAVNAVIDDVAATHPAVAGLVRTKDLLCDGDRGRATLDGVPLRVDGVHFSPEGAAVLWPHLSSRIEELLPGGTPLSVQRARESAGDLAAGSPVQR
jgi:peptidoglycan/LPS O-acetylase OafA/YrhL/lysophospholipase L1-like esterase